MIEFKADCGHTIRAKDDEGGGVVRCTYCGRQTQIPETRETAIDSLFNEIDDAAERGSAPVPKGRRGRRKKLISGRRSSGAFNPFPLILRLCYGALLISIVIVVVRKFVIPLWDQPRRSPSLTKQEDLPLQKPRDPASAAQPASPTEGLLDRNQLLGLYVTSTPPGATVYCVSASNAPPAGRIHRANGCNTYSSQAGPLRVSDGMYVVELVLAWNDPGLKRYRGYKEFRQDLERATENQRKQLVENYFLPDEASAVFFDETEEQKYIVRQYHDVEVRDGRSAGVRGLFLPRLSKEDGRFSIEELVVNNLPETAAYSYNEQYVRDELEYYRVDPADQAWVLKALARIGVIPYMTAEKRLLIFKIGIEDGAFATRVIRESGK